MTQRILQPTAGLSSDKIARKVVDLNGRNFNSYEKPCSVQLITASSDVIQILHGMGLYDQNSKYSTIWINGTTYYVPDCSYSDAYGANRDWVLDINKVGIDSGNFLGGSLDNQSPGAAAELKTWIVWAIANDANTEFKGFGFTRRPKAAYTAIVNGTKGSSIATITMAGTGLNQAYRFSVGGTCVVRNAVGTAPNYEWCQGEILEIVDNENLVVQMYNHDNDGSTDVSDAVGEIVQFDNFRCFNDQSYKGYEEASYLNARAVGEFKTIGDGFIGALRGLRDQWYCVSPVEIGIRITSTGSKTANWKRWIEPWVRAIEIKFDADTTGSITWQVDCEVTTVAVNTVAKKMATEIMQLHLPPSAPWHEITATITGTGTLDNVCIIGTQGEMRP